MAEPVPPYVVFLGERDITEHEKMLNKAIGTVNMALLKSLINSGGRVVVHLEECNLGVQLEVVHKFRKVGWDVNFGTIDKRQGDTWVKEYYVEVGVFKGHTMTI
jgi:hypothetical protein